MRDGHALFGGTLQPLGGIGFVHRDAVAVQIFKADDEFGLALPALAIWVSLSSGVTAAVCCGGAAAVGAAAGTVCTGAGFTSCGIRGLTARELLAGCVCTGMVTLAPSLGRRSAAGRVGTGAVTLACGLLNSPPTPLSIVWVEVDVSFWLRMAPAAIAKIDSATMTPIQI